MSDEQTSTIPPDSTSSTFESTTLESAVLKPSRESEHGGSSQGSSDGPGPGAGGHGAASSGGAHGDEHFAHTTPFSLLVGVLGALVILTILTVAVTAVDLGSQGNFIVAMIIATIKAGLVMAYFMHLVWDSRFNVVAFLSSFLFVLLFLSMALLDRREYQSGIDQFEADAAATAK